MYRYLYIETSIPSRELGKIIPYCKMERLCWNFEHYEPQYTADGIIAEYGFKKLRYDRDYKPMTKEELALSEKQQYEKERERLKLLGIDESIFPPCLR